jgi:hypothetical protein
MTTSPERLARNQSLFREVNERLLELADGSRDGPLEIVCECSLEDCTTTLAVHRDDYEAVRAHSTHFLVTSGHELLEVERVVDRRDGFTVVEKVTETDFAVETDPRRDDSGE